MARTSPRARMRLAGDDRLTEWVRDGDRRAFEAIYDRYGGDLLRFATYMLGTQQDAEDAVQASFTAAYGALMADRRQVALRPWLFTITRNECVSVLRGRRPTAELNGEITPTDDPVQRLEVREEFRQMLAGIAGLPEQQRAALVLAAVHGLTHPEIAAILGVRTDQVKAFVYQARTNLLADRRARAIDCREIREELAQAHGHVFLRGRLRRHLRACSGCREYAEHLIRQRRALRALVPLIPSLALKHRALEGGVGVGGLGASGSCAGSTLLATSITGLAEVADSLNALVLKVAVGAVALTATAGVGASVLDGSKASPVQSAPLTRTSGAARLASVVRPRSQVNIRRTGRSAPGLPRIPRVASPAALPATTQVNYVARQERPSVDAPGAPSASGEHGSATVLVASQREEPGGSSQGTEAERQQRASEREAAREQQAQEHEQREGKHEEHGPPRAAEEPHGKSEEHRPEGVAKGPPSEAEREQMQEAHEAKKEEHKPEQPPKK